MTCDLDRVDALADGRLDGPEAKEVMEHLAGCPQCRAYYEGALAADRVLADTGINPPADFAAGVMERIRLLCENCFLQQIMCNSGRIGGLRNSRKVKVGSVV